MAVELLTVTDYARRRKCDEKAVRRAILENRITVILDAKGRKRIDPEVADIQWAKNTRARADSQRAGVAAPAGQGGGSGTASEVAGALGFGASADQPSYSDYRARTEKATAERAERENAREAGRLVESAQVKRGIYDSFRALRDAAMAVSQRAAPRCIGLADARDIEQVIRDELRLAFEGWEQRMLDLLPVEEITSQGTTTPVPGGGGV
jgi:hypothetical protein